MINPKNKRVEITLSPEDYELLLSLTLRFNDNKSEIISKALKILASKNRHDLHLMFRESYNYKILSETEKEELKKEINKKYE